MHVSRVAQQEAAALAKLVGNAIVDPVSGEPVNFVDLNVESFRKAAFSLVPFERLAAAIHRPDQAGSTRRLERKNGEKTGVFERPVELSIHGGSAGLDIGDEEDVRISGSWEVLG